MQTASEKSDAVFFYVKINYFMLQKYSLYASAFENGES